MQSWGPFFPVLVFLVILAMSLGALGAFATVAAPSYAVYRSFGPAPASAAFLALAVSMWAGLTWLESRKVEQRPWPALPVEDPVARTQQRVFAYFVIAGAVSLVAFPVLVFSGKRK